MSSYFLLIIYLTSGLCHSFPFNYSEMISIPKYAKVAHWGSVTTQTPLEGRSHNGQTLWTQRVDARLSSGQVMRQPSVIYQYPEKKDSKMDPGVGEVQERFNPRPYFEYSPVNKYSNKKNEKKPQTFDSFPVFTKPDTGSYSSGLTSYDAPVNPPQSEDTSSIPYPPNGPPPPDDMKDIPKPSMGPPLAPTDDDDKLYYPPSEGGDTILDHPPPGYEEDDKPAMKQPEQDKGMMPAGKAKYPEVILDHPPPGWEDKPSHPNPWEDQPAPNSWQDKPPMAPQGPKDMAEHDLSPPPSDDHDQFPHYLYNEGHSFDQYDDHDHHVYKEVTTTPKSDERVNKGQYSYFYLGKKLYYIPLYFSVYFIVYVTVLILKSIARHKIQFKHDLHDLAHGKREHRNLNLFQNVTSSIEAGHRKFSYIAMK